MINWEKAQIRIRTKVLFSSVSLSINEGDSIGIIGENGTGKTILAKAFAGLIKVSNLENISSNLNTVYVSFQTEFKAKHGTSNYRQLRWNYPDPELMPTVRKEFNAIENQVSISQLVSTFSFENQLDKMVISLSNGEQRKFELIKALAQKPDLLIIDNAFISLDANSRKLLSEMVNQLILKKQSLVLTGITAADFPLEINKFFHLEDGTVSAKSRKEIPLTYINPNQATYSLPLWNNSTFSNIIELKNLGLSYNGKYILKDISWKVNAGEKWVLSGANGSGKTSLLNMIFADNPKAYLNDIKLFGRKKGSGESIWDIKRNIGFISPEMQQYYPGNPNAIQVICSGFYESEGLYHKPTGFQKIVAQNWLKLVDLSQIATKPLKTLCTSSQRIVLILRTLVKNPALLILDEPFQGLDENNIQKMKYLLNLIGKYTNCTMIFVTHFEEEIPNIFNKEIKLNKGKIEFCGLRKAK